MDTIGRGVPMQRCSASPEVSRPFTATVKTGVTVLECATDLAADIATDRAKPGRAFACPGLFRIVPARDGGICRIKLPRGRLRSTQARAIASAADQFATGAIEATNRANIQIRGIQAGNESRIIAALLEAGLGAPNAGADDIRNVMVSPLAGDDTAQITDVRGLADFLLDRLQAEPRYHALSPKFSIQIDGGESLARLDHPNDIWLSAVAGLEKPTYAFGFAGCPSQGNRDHAAGFVAAENASDLVLACIDYFLPFNGALNAAGQEISRFRHLLADHPATEIIQATSSPVRCDVVTHSWRRATTEEMAHIGLRQQLDRAMVAVGAMPPLGRLDPMTLNHLADLADKYSDGEIRLTPWQSILLPNVATERSAELIGALGAMNFATASNQPLAAIITCAGSTGCASGRADTKSDALALAQRMGSNRLGTFGIHLTGCSKSCAAPRPAQATLLGVAPGRYDIFWRDGNSAGKFGKALGNDLTIAEADDLLARHFRNKGKNDD